ncbi:MAG: Gfo/Idh/MocA family oxidoreductase [Clostridia bacterium]|nr:Gfo/Idh/MocA family oxidoreductase [Clostridia bacterium]
MKKVRLGILGMGNMGSGHLENILNDKCPEIEVTAVCDVNPARLEFALGRLAVHRESKPENNYPDIATFADGDEMFNSGLVDAVIIAIPHYGHPEYAIKAMQAGLHVMCEKPAGVYTLQVREMMAEADRHPGLKFGMMFNQRTNHIYRKVKEIMDSGELGAIKRTSWIITNWYRPQAYYDSGAWRATWSGEGGGVLLNQCPHNLDLWQWICGMPKTIDVKMHFGKWHDIEVEDDVTAYVEYENGATGTFITTTGDAPGTNRLEIVCEGGTIITDGGSITLIKLDTPEPVFSATNKSAFAAPKTQRVAVETDGQNPQHVGVLNAFAGAILRDEPLVADGREGINGLTISNAMHLSAWTGEAVTLPLDEHKFRDLLFEHVKTSRRKEGIEAVFSSTEGTYNS